MRLTVMKAKQLFPGIKIAAQEPNTKAAGRPAEPSKIEAVFAAHCRLRKLPMFKREYLFAKEAMNRLWRFDFAWPEFKVAVEIEGLVIRYINGEQLVYGRHATVTGFNGDSIKYGKANELGWHVNRFSQMLVKDLTAVDMTMDLLKARGWVQ